LYGRECGLAVSTKGKRGGKNAIGA